MSLMWSFFYESSNPTVKTSRSFSCETHSFLVTFMLLIKKWRHNSAPTADWGLTDADRKQWNQMLKIWLEFTTAAL